MKIFMVDIIVLAGISLEIELNRDIALLINELMNIEVYAKAVKKFVQYIHNLLMDIW